MPSPYGQQRSASTYYQNAGAPRHYAYNWTGMPMAPSWAGETRGLGDYSVAMTMASGRHSLLNSGIEQSQIYDSVRGGLGAMSRSEKKYLTLAVLGVAGFFIWKKYLK